MLLLKLTLGPLLIAAATLVTRRWGPRAGGLLMGLPLTTGPIFLALALEQGAAFAAAATVGILDGLVGLSAFVVAYVHVSNRFGWIVSLFCATVSFLACSALARGLGGGALVAGLAAAGALGCALALIRRPVSSSTRVVPPRWDLWARMGAVAGLTLIVTAVAARIGPVYGGIVGTYPVMMTVAIPFTHVQYGRDAAVAMLRASVLLWFGFAGCFMAIGVGTAPLGIAISVVLGVMVTMGSAVVALWADRSMMRMISGRTGEN